MNVLLVLPAICPLDAREVESDLRPLHGEALAQLDLLI